MKTWIARLPACLFWLASQQIGTPAAQEAQLLPAAGPVCQRAEHRQPDFWAGVWDVRQAGTPETKPTTSSNTIEKAHGGCVIGENWKTPEISGQSLNI